ncbi:N-acetylmuramoyl-L-alanine amidase [Streptomyces sp. NPDC051940]|uniref:N-acetylmuramoyl-L-alanine amidase n=1 Tax=Streptomyces sp. NPDC051940 TaxID=3155675 RepID=UPI0034324602
MLDARRAFHSPHVAAAAEALAGAGGTGLRRFVHAWVAAGLLLPALAAAAPSARADDASLQQAFVRAAERYRVPQDVLLAVSYLESRWDGYGGAPSVAGGYGPMHLTEPAGRAAGGPPPTLPQAARLTGLAPRELRESAAANVQGGAAVLADLQRRLDLPTSADPADWYGAVAAYSAARDERSARSFADEVYDVLRTGARRTTDDGDRMVLPPHRGLRPHAEQLALLGLAKAAAGRAECPAELACEWIPAPYKEFRGAGGEPDYGNHDLARRPLDMRVRYIVIHDTEGGYAGSVQAVQNPEFVSWQYTIRSRDGHVAQHVPLKAVAWHAGNWHVNSQSIGIEHEARLVSPDTWFTEAMYRSSAKLVRWLAGRYDVPLDRQHIIGHDNVPAGTPGAVSGMHTDPGPYWDWAHYFELLGAPFKAQGGPRSGAVTILPDYASHRPRYTSCHSGGDTCPAHGSGAVRLRSAPDPDAPLVKDVGLHSGEGRSSSGVNDTGARASTGQQFAVAGRKGAWTAIWYLGQKAWFHNPKDRPVAVPATGRVVTPRPGLEKVRVYGRVLPEPAAFPEGIKVVEQTPLPYTLKAGQRYVLGDRVPSEHYHATEFSGPTQRRVVRGRTVYYEIQFGHRIAYVKAADVVVSPAGTAPRAGA